MIGDFNLHAIINDFLMAIFFLYVGLEIKKEMLEGSLSSFKKASFPVIASLGGVIVPAIIFMMINRNTHYLPGVGVAISTDIAFVIGIFMLFKSKLNSNLKIFLLSLAVVDDLISILAIVFLYSAKINMTAVMISVVILLILMTLNKVFKVDNLYVYLFVGLLLWYFVYSSGIHATISGVLLAATIPSRKTDGEESTAVKLEHKLGKLSNLIILPLFAFANTSIVLNLNINVTDASNLVMGIICGLVIGKPLGVVSFSYIATKLHIAEKDSWISITEVALLTGIGFTMSIFVSELAFAYDENVINLAKISILTASMISIMLIHMALTLKHSPVGLMH
ncbi:Na(+)/H(+) antiporter NhaA [Terrisporobacter mayombei]|uniref:Na(+)/H(+) antiporter NhaA n=1 Tax=Terrisporobacter mayombei TaxID=1541 RepID=A0ABY9Q5B4_9FIRM|nr:Na(+)/H(+) antiporter NhaA [Terrisporobacter mayombei]